jgi:signal transduction histidine kinase
MTREPRLDPVLGLIVAMCLLLPGLAMLQFSWIGDVEKADEARMRASLQRSSDHLGEEFNGEIARFYRAVLAPAGPLNPPAAAPGAPSSADDPCQRFARWHSAAAQPRLIRAIYLLPQQSHDDEQLESCNLETGKREPATWPDDLKATARLWRPSTAFGHVSINFKDYVPMLPAPWRLARPPEAGAPDGPAGRRRPPFPPESRQDRPPMRPFGGFRPGFGPGARGADPGRLGMVLAVPDLAWVQTQWLPELISKHFGNPATSEAVVHVEITVPHIKVYESGPWSPGPADAEAVLWHAPGLNPVLGLGMNPAMEAGPNPAPGPGMDSRLDRSIEPRAILRAAGASYWTLLARLRAGPVAEVAARTRNRNLAVGGGVLLLLGATMALLIATLRRQRRLNRQQMEFVAGVSHELRTPVAVLSSAGENLADGIVTEPAAVREYGALVRDESRRLSGMIEQTLRFAGIEGGGVRYNLQPVDVVEAIETALRNHDSLIRGSGCVVERNWPEMLPLVEADPAALAHCIGNLLANAARYAASGRWIGVRVAVQPPAKGAPEQLTIEVADRGEGIDAQDLPYLFEPFYRGRQSRELQIQGTGLGLALVKRIMEDLGGSVRVHALRPRGSCFTLTLPVVPSTGSAAAEPDAA